MKMRQMLVELVRRTHAITDVITDCAHILAPQGFQLHLFCQ